MKGTGIKSMAVWTTIGCLLLFSALPSWAAEIRFLKTRFMNAQQLLGSTLLVSARLKWAAGKIQEDLGLLIREEGPLEKIDQELLGKEIAKGAQLKWREGRTQEQLGSAVLKSSKIVAQEEEIKGGVREELGRVILSQAQLQWIDPKALEISAQRKAGLAQEALGREIQKKARFAWAEAALARRVQRVLLSAGRDGVQIPEEVFSVLRKESGRTYEENLLQATRLMDKGMGRALGQILPSRPEVIRPFTLMETPNTGWGGFGEFGLPALLGFFWSIGVFLWFWAGLERPPLEHPPLDKAWKQAAKADGLHKAA